MKLKPRAKRAAVSGVHHYLSARPTNTILSGRRFLEFAGHRMGPFDRKMIEKIAEKINRARVQIYINELGVASVSGMDRGSKEWHLLCKVIAPHVGPITTVRRNF